MGRILLVVVMLVFSFGQTQPVLAAPLSVDCSVPDLIAAIQAANASVADDVIDLQADCTYLLTAVNNPTSGDNGLPVIASETTAGKLTIHGNDAKIVRGVYTTTWLPMVIRSSTTSSLRMPERGANHMLGTASVAPDFRVLMIASGGNLTLDHVSVQKGNVPWQNGGAIFNAGTLILTNSTISGSSAHYGGGIYNTGILVASNSTFSGNAASGTGGSIDSAGALTVSSSTFNGSSARLGDGILVAEGTSTIINNTFSGDATFICPLSPATVPGGDTTGLVDDILCADSGPGDNVINLTNSSYTLKVVDNNDVNGYGATGLPVIDDVAVAGKLTITGNGGTIERSSASDTPYFRIWFVAPGGDLTLDHVTVQKGGLATDNDGSNATNGGGIYNLGTLSISNSTVSGNSSVFAGGVDNEGMLTITGSTFANNAIKRDGAAITSNGTLVVSNSLFTGNTAQGLCGGILIGHGTATVTNTVFSGNATHEMAGGGGILNINGTVTVTGSTFSNNHADGAGGGIFNGGGSVIVKDSTFVNNTAATGGGIWNGASMNVTQSTFLNNTGGRGGGIWNGGTLTVTHSTISGNSSHNNFTYGGGGIGMDSSAATLNLGSTIVAGNTADQSAPDILGTINSLGYNLIGSTTDTIITGNLTGNLTDAGAAPLNLGPLQNNGGPTETMALGSGSVAIDAGDPAFSAPPDFDQRGTGFPRVVGGRIDIGAYEK